MYSFNAIRIWFMAGLALCGLVIASALWLELVDGLEPCPMCMLQRIIYGVVALFCLGGVIAGKQHYLWARGFAVGVTLVSLLGMGVAVRQLYLQSLPVELRPDNCMGMSFYFLAESWPVLDVIKVMFEGSADCGNVLWRLFGLSIPGWSFVSFGSLAFLGWMLGFITLRRLAPRTERDD